jgi:hydroxymethylbilane synthase
MLRLATRRSALARWQAGEVARLLQAAHPGLEVELVLIETAGDRRLDQEVWELGGQGVFVKEIQGAVLAGDADLAVHSAKDLQSTEIPGLILAAFPSRADARDTLVGAALRQLAPGATVATGSIRRRAQLAHLRPDLNFVGLRGNIATRLSKVPAGGAVLVAQAALDRLGLGDQAAEILEPAVMMPQVGQGTMAVECRSGDRRVVDLLSTIDDPATAVAMRAERAFLARLGSGCDLPVGAYATLQPGDTLRIDGVVASTDGQVVLRERREGPAASAAELGAELAVTLLDEAGGRALLAGGSR